MFIRALDNFGTASPRDENETGKTRVGILIGVPLPTIAADFYEKRRITLFTDRYFGTATSQKHDHRIWDNFAVATLRVNNGGRSVRCETTVGRTHS